MPASAVVNHGVPCGTGAGSFSWPVAGSKAPCPELPRSIVAVNSRIAVTTSASPPSVPRTFDCGWPQSAGYRIGGSRSALGSASGANLVMGWPLSSMAPKSAGIGVGAPIVSTSSAAGCPTVSAPSFGTSGFRSSTVNLPVKPELETRSCPRTWRAAVPMAQQGCRPRRTWRRGTLEHLRGVGRCGLEPLVPSWRTQPCAPLPTSVDPVPSRP